MERIALHCPFERARLLSRRPKGPARRRHRCRSGRHQIKHLLLCYPGKLPCGPPWVTGEARLIHRGRPSPPYLSHEPLRPPLLLAPTARHASSLLHMTRLVFPLYLRRGASAKRPRLRKMRAAGSQCHPDQQTRHPRMELAQRNVPIFPQDCHLAPPDPMEYPGRSPMSLKYPLLRCHRAPEARSASWGLVHRRSATKVDLQINCSSRIKAASPHSRPRQR